MNYANISEIHFERDANRLVIECEFTRFLFSTLYDVRIKYLVFSTLYDVDIRLIRTLLNKLPM